MKKNNKGFTLVELLAVLIIMVVVFGIGIPSVIKIIEDRSNDEYNIQLKLIKNGVTLYKDRYKHKFDKYKDKSCFLLSYQTNLIDEGLVKEKDVTCSGTIVLRRINDTNSFTQTNYLDCSDTNKNYVLSSKASSVPATDRTNCVDLSGADTSTISTEIPVPKIKSNVSSNTWQKNDVIVMFDQTVDTNYNYQYYTSSSPVIPSNSVEVRAVPSNNQVTISTSGSHYVWFRAVDKTNTSLVSNWSNMVEVNIDKESPSTLPTITASDGIASNTAHTENFVLVVTGGNNLSGNIYKYGINTTPNQILTDGFYVVTLDSIPAGGSKTFNVIACSKADNTKCGQTKSYIIKK